MVSKNFMHSNFSFQPFL